MMRVVLPTVVRPTKYSLVLEPDLNQFVFSGHVDIEFTVNAPTTRITVNSRGLNITLAKINDRTNASQIETDEELHRVTFVFDDLITAGVLHVEFDGELNDRLVGFYRAKYEKEGQVRYMAVTQFAANDARRCFPCFDEPAIKAEFELTLIVPKDRTALSNTSVISESESGEKKTVKFATTPLMSTYLLAFAVGEFDYVESQTERGVVVRVYTQVGRSVQGKFALDVATKVLPLLEKYFDIDYPLNKLDMIALPELSFGAMENWGLITYRENNILIDPESSSSSAKQRVALVVSHEISHQWFGNLVTFEWWQDLWLNEGFANWIEYWCVDQLYPEWNVFEQFIHMDYERAQNLDGLSSSHPIEIQINNATEVDDAFDAITYAKGCVIIRMLVEYVGIETFKAGIISYLKEYKYRNATTNDLWKVLSDNSGKDIKSLMQTWTTQTGFPVLIVEKTEQNNTLKVTQYRYLDSGVQYEDPSLWHIPFSYISDVNSTPVKLLITERSCEIQLEGTNFKWIKFNPEQYGFYRVHYPSEFIQQLIPAIQSKQLRPIDRLSIQDDVYCLALSRVSEIDQALTVLSAYGNEDNYTVWSSVIAKIESVYNLLKQSDMLEPFKSFVRSLLKQQRDILGFFPKEDDTYLESVLRVLIVAVLVKYGDPITTNTAFDYFRTCMNNNSQMIPDLQGPVLYAGVSNGGEAEFNYVLDLYNASTLQEEKQRCLKALAATNSPQLLDRLFQLLTTDSISGVDVISLAMFLSVNPAATDKLWKWFSSNVDTLKKKYDGTILYGRLIKSCTCTMTTREQLTEVELFFAQEHVRSLSSNRSIDQAIEAIHLSVNQLEHSIERIRDYFNSAERKD